MVYAKTRVSPPKTPDAVEQYTQNLDASIADLVNFKSHVKMDSCCDDDVNRLKLFNAEDKISDEESDIELEKLVCVYTPRFLGECFSSFNKSVWNEADHEWMNDRANKLKALKYSNNSSALRRSSIDSLNLVSSIISAYNDARRVSRSSTFSGWSNAKSTLDQVNKYTNHTYLSHNSSLMSDLKNVKARLAESCFNQLTYKVNQLANYRSLSQDYFMETLVPQVESALHDYDNNASGVFGSKSSTSNLWGKAREYCSDATDFYSRYHTKSQLYYGTSGNDRGEVNR